MQTTTEVRGKCDERFKQVQEAFAGNFEKFDEAGASVAVTVDGQPVVDLWGGYMDGARTRPWERDTIVNVWSTTKGIVAACAHRLVDQGLLDLDAPVATYWPEFGQAGKEDIPVRYLLSHQAGLPALREPLPAGSAFNWEVMTEALAKEEPWWEPGAKHGYHAFTWGWLVGEVMRRVSGQSVGTYFRKEVGEPLGLDLYIGLDPEHDARTAEVISPELPQPGETNFVVEMLRDPQSMPFKVLANPPDLFLPGVVNTRDWRAAEIPAANGHGNARAVARLYGALARGGELDGVRILSPEAIERAIVEQASGRDEVLGLDLRIGLGFVLAHGGEERRAMIVTTTHDLQGKDIQEYLGIVVGETILATNIFRDIGAGLRDLVGGRSGAYEKKMTEARETAIQEMSEKAQALGADAVVGVDIDYETVGNGMMMVSASGTAVRTG